MASTQRLGAAVRRRRPRSPKPELADVRDADRAAPRLAAVDRRLQQPGPGAQVSRLPGSRAASTDAERATRRVRTPIRRPIARSCTRPARATSRRSTSARCRTRSSSVKIANADAAALAIRTMWVRGAPLIGAVGAYGLALALDRDACDDALAQGARGARRDAADRGQPALGARPRARTRSPPLAGRRARRRRVARGRRDRRRGRRDQPRDRRARPRAAARRSRAQRVRARPRDDPLQCRRARDLRLGHGDGAAVPRARRGTAAARLGQRDAAAAAGREPHRVGDGRRGIPHTLFADARERAPDAARRRRHRVSSAPTASPATATSATRSAPTRRRSRRATTAFRSTSRCRRRRSMRRSRPATRSRSRRAAPTKCWRSPAATATGRRPRSRSRPPGTRAVNYAFDVTPARLVTGLITERGVAAADRAGAGRRCFRSAFAGERTAIDARARAARRGHRHGARDERAGHQPRQVGQRQRALSGRRFDGFLITPTGMPYDTIGADDIVAMTSDGEARGARLPSSEWRFHRDIYAARADVDAIVHTHSPFATTLACLRARHSGVPLHGRRRRRHATSAARLTRRSARRRCPITRWRRSRGAARACSRTTA